MGRVTRLELAFEVALGVDGPPKDHLWAVHLRPDYSTLVQELWVADLLKMTAYLRAIHLASNFAGAWELAGVCSGSQGVCPWYELSGRRLAVRHISSFYALAGVG